MVSPLKIGQMRCPETSENNHNSTLHNIQKSKDLIWHLGGSLISPYFLKDMLSAVFLKLFAERPLVAL